MPAGKSMVSANLHGCKGENPEQDEWQDAPPSEEHLRWRIRSELNEMLQYVERAAGKSEYEPFEKEVVRRVFRLGRLVIALFLLLWQERTPVAPTVVRGKEEYGRQPAKPRLLGTFFGKVRYLQRRWAPWGEYRRAHLQGSESDVR